MKENDKQRKVIEQQGKELDLISWYIKFEMDGRTAKQMMEDLEEAESQVALYKQLLYKERKEFDRKFRKENKRANQCMEKLTEMQNKLVKPLIFEYNVNEEINRRLNQD